MRRVHQKQGNSDRGHEFDQRHPGGQQREKAKSVGDKAASFPAEGGGLACPEERSAQLLMISITIIHRQLLNRII